ncbi:MAG: SMC-Scp complex subunit ScpB [Pirellula sp.]|jgi:segregation and condensation protein B|nr:SMC-Scp complex subunit ScpB [Pirellula sp.]
MVFGRRLRKIESDDFNSEVPTEETGVSLEELSRAYAEAIGTEEQSGPVSPGATPLNLTDEQQDELLDAPDVADSDGLPVTTEGVLEAILFVGGDSSHPIPVDRILGLFPGMPIDELDEIIARLNKKYRSLGNVIEIVNEKGGYRMKLLHHASNLRDRFQGKVREVSLQQAAIDCLAMIAYTPGITRQEIENLWGNSPTGTLNLLLRKGLLRAVKDGTATRYYTTDKFLEIAGITSLDDLPREEL